MTAEHQPRINPFHHIDLRVSNLEAALRFYEQVMPAIGFTHKGKHTEPYGITWEMFVVDNLRPSPIFAITEAANHVPNRNCIAFFVESRAEVECIASIVKKAGGQNIEGPCECPEYSETYYAVFFEDPSGNRLEVVNWGR